MNTDKHEVNEDYHSLTPDLVINALESLGFEPDGRLFALNSYENRVYQLSIYDQEPLIVKFYRPARWTNEQILEEHQYALRLADLELPAVAPMMVEESSLHCYKGYDYAIFRRQGGQYPEPGDFDQLHQIGRLMGRMHQAMQSFSFKHRQVLDLDTYVKQSHQYLVEHDFLPSHLVSTYSNLIEGIEQQIAGKFDLVARLSSSKLTYMACHGDCHLANILWHRETGPWFVDFDDCKMAPAIQDLWMMLSGTRLEQEQQLSELMEGYQEFCAFNPAELHLIESLRTMRMIHYSAWLARRWGDIAFPKAFPWFNTDAYWQEQITSLTEQSQIIQGEPLRLF